MDRAHGSKSSFRGGENVTVTYRSNALSTSAVTHDSELHHPNSNPPHIPGSSRYSAHSGQLTPAGCGSNGIVSVGSTRAASHSPAVWLLDDSLCTGVESTAEMREGEDQADLEMNEEWHDRLDGDSRGRRAGVHHMQSFPAPWVVDAVEANLNKAQVPPPRVLDNRLHLSPLPASSAGSRGSSRSLRSVKAVAAFSSHEALVSAPPEEATEDLRTASDDSYASSHTDAHTNTSVPTTSSRPRRPLPLPAVSQRAGTPHQPTALTVAAPTPITSPRSHSSASSHSSPALPHPTIDAGPSPSSRSYFTCASPTTSLEVDGVGPLMVVHLDVLPALRHLSTTSPDGQHTGEEKRCHCGDGAMAAVDAEGPTRRSTTLAVHLSETEEEEHLFYRPATAVDLHDGSSLRLVAVKALMAHEADETHAREVAALYEKLEVAEQRARIAEQQVSTTAEVRAAELVQRYKADERQRRTQFQAALDALREENRELTAKLEAATRAPATGFPHPPTSLLPYTSPATMTTEEAGGTLTTTVASEVDVMRQVQSVEAYWRDRLRNAERHWEDEMAQQSRQRREALNHVDELVRVVEQTQEELKYSRRHAARLREENVRLCNAAAAAPVWLSTSGKLSSGAVPDEEVTRLRQAVKAHEQREAALLAQVESYGEEATQVRLRYEAALEKAQQDLTAERRRCTEMVKLYGSQLESLHYQLREAKRVGASR